VETQVYDQHSLIAAITGAQFGDRMWAVGLEVVRTVRLPALTAAAVDQFGPLLALAALGLLVLTLERFWLAALTLAWAISTTWFVLRYLVDDWLTLLLPVWLLVGLWALAGLHRCLSRAGSRGHRVVTGAVAAAPRCPAARLRRSGPPGPGPSAPGRRRSRGRSGQIPDLRRRGTARPELRWSVDSSAWTSDAS
jgi:hypothetical protein